MKKDTQRAADEFRQWLSRKPANVGPNDLVALKCSVELFTTGWIDLATIARKMNWTLEETVNELLQHCSEVFQHEPERLLRQIGADDDKITAALAAASPINRN